MKKKKKANDSKILSRLSKDLYNLDGKKKRILRRIKEKTDLIQEIRDRSCKNIKESNDFKTLSRLSKDLYNLDGKKKRINRAIKTKTDSIREVRDRICKNKIK